MDCWEKMAKTTKRMMAVDDEDTDGDIDNDLLTLYQVHLAPVSSQQAAELSEKMFSAPICGAFNKAFFHFQWRLSTLTNIV